MSPVVLALLPDLAVVALGCALRGVFARATWAAVDAVNARVLFPALIFAAAASHPASLDDLVAVGGGVAGVILLGFALAGALRPLGPRRFLDFAAVWQTAWRFNTALALVAVQTLPAETRGLMSVAIGVGVPLANVLAVTALSRGAAGSIGATARRVALNPFLLASLAGLSFSLSGLALPAVASGALDRLAAAAVPMALLSIGAALDLRALARIDAFAAALNAIKLVVLPLAAFVGGGQLGLDADARAVLTLFAAVPTAAGAHVLAASFGADTGGVARAIAQSTLLGCLTLPVWAALAAG